MMVLNRFLHWTFFGGEGVISENSRDEQRKAIKYNHLVANCLIFHNLCSLTRLTELALVISLPSRYRA